MLTIISPAKTMSADDRNYTIDTSVPLYESSAKELASIASGFSKEELAKLLKISSQQAELNYGRYRNLVDSKGGGKPALLQYDGVVFKHLLQSEFTDENFLFAQDYLRICSFMYGMLRPLDAIRPYRMEGTVRFEALGNKSIFDFWKDKLTDALLEDVRKRGDVLLNLASGEMKKLFEWKRIEREVDIITPEFRVYKNGVPKNVTVFSKMARGEMARYIIRNRIESPQLLNAFEWEGFSYDTALSTEKNPIFSRKEF